MQSTHAHAHSALAVILSHAATQKHPYLAPQNGHLRGRGCYMRHTERPSGRRPRSLMRSRFKVRRDPALELSPTICFLDSTRRATISRGHLGGRCDYPALPVRQSGSRGMRGRIWVTTGQDKPLKPGGTGHHALVNPFQIYFPENCKTGTLANFWRLRSAHCWAGDAAHGGDVIMRCQMTSTTDSESRQAYGTRPKLGIKKVHLRQTAKTGVVINTPRPFPLVFGF